MAILMFVSMTQKTPRKMEKEKSEGGEKKDKSCSATLLQLAFLMGKRPECRMGKFPMGQHCEKQQPQDGQAI